MSPSRQPEDAPEDDLVVFIDDDDDTLVLPPVSSSAPAPKKPQPPGAIDPGSVSWTVLVVDDERAVHAVTKLALARLKVEGGRLRLLHAHSGAEARDILAQEPSCALILLDVVMETEQEGLELTRWIRSSLGNDQIRIILRTGQPGRAPEASVMASYDIHDYHPKTEVSAQRLRTSVTGGIRAWRDLQSLSLQRRALERVIQASGNLMQPQSLRELLRGIFGQLGSLLYPRNNALFFMAPRDIFTKDRGSPIILAGSGRFEDLVNLEVADVLSAEHLAQIEATVRPGEWVDTESNAVYGFDLGTDYLPTLFLEDASRLPDWERHALSLFCANAAVALKHHAPGAAWEELVASSQRFAPRQLVQLLGESSAHGLSADSQATCRATVAVLSLDGLSAWVEAESPQHTLDALQAFYRLIEPILEGHGDPALKYAGDRLVLLFTGSPEDATAAIEQVIPTANRWIAGHEEASPKPLTLHCGLAHGDVLIGTLGYQESLDIVLISDTVNIAWALVERCQQLQAQWLSAGQPASHEGGSDRYLGHLALRGRRGLVPVVEHFSIDPEPLRAQKHASAESFRSAVKAREHGDWDQATTLFQECYAPESPDTVAAWLGRHPRAERDESA